MMTILACEMQCSIPVWVLGINVEVIDTKDSHYLEMASNASYMQGASLNLRDALFVDISVTK